MEMEVVLDHTLESPAQLVLPGGMSEVGFLVAGPTSDPMILDLLELPKGSSVYIRVQLGEQILSEKVYEGGML